MDERPWRNNTAAGAAMIRTDRHVDDRDKESFMLVLVIQYLLCLASSHFIDELGQQQ